MWLKNHLDIRGKNQQLRSGMFPINKHVERIGNVNSQAVRRFLRTLLCKTDDHQFLTHVSGPADRNQKLSDVFFDRVCC